MGFPPRLFLIGAQKAGTTQLAALLGQHPEICLSNPKEPAFFSRNWAARDLGAYRLRFKDPAATWLLDASTCYSCSPLPRYDKDGSVGSDPRLGVAARIASVSEDPRFLYLMRDPVARVHSSYWHGVRAGYEKRPFDLAIREDTSYLRAGAYQLQLQQYLRWFPREHFHLMLFEEFRADPVATAKECFRFLGLDPDVEISVSGGRNRSFRYSGLARVADKLLSPVGGISPVAKLVARHSPPSVKRLAARVLTKDVPPLTASQREFLRAHYAEFDEDLQRVIGRKLPWRQ